MSLLLARISFNGRNLDFTKVPYQYQPEPPRNRLITQTPGAVYTLGINVEQNIAYSFRRFENSNTTDATLKRGLEQWFQWAQTGAPWTFAYYFVKVFNNNLSIAGNVGDTTLTLVDATGLANGDICIVRNTVNMEKIKLNGNPAGNVITLTEPLSFSYPSGARVRHELFWPGRLINNTNPIRENQPFWWDFELKFQEDVNGL